MATTSEYIAFEGDQRIASGSLPEVALKVKHALDRRVHGPVLVFNLRSSELVDFDHRGTPEQMLKRLAASAGKAEPETNASAETPAPAGPGRPRLGVVAREVTLLPRHWEWLGTQPGGASVALRKLVEQARRDNLSKDSARQSQEASYRFMSAMAGNNTGFEEAARALFSGDRERFRALLAPWPSDIRAHLEQLAAPCFDAHAAQEGQHA